PLITSAWPLRFTSTSDGVVETLAAAVIRVYRERCRTLSEKTATPLRCGRLSSDRLTLRSSTPLLFQNSITTTLCASSACFIRTGRPGPAAPVCERFAGVTLVWPLLGSLALADEPGFAVGDWAGAGVWLGAGVEDVVSPGLRVTKKTTATRTTPTMPRRIGRGTAPMLMPTSKGPSLPLPPFG